MKGGKINALEVSVELKECWVEVEQESRNDKKRKWLESRLSKIEITGGGLRLPADDKVHSRA